MVEVISPAPVERLCRFWLTRWVTRETALAWTAVSPELVVMCWLASRSCRLAVVSLWVWATTPRRRSCNFHEQVKKTADLSQFIVGEIACDLEALGDIALALGDVLDHPGQALQRQGNGPHQGKAAKTDQQHRHAHERIDDQREVTAAGVGLSRFRVQSLAQFILMCGNGAEQLLKGRIRLLDDDLVRFCVVGVQQEIDHFGVGPG